MKHIPHKQTEVRQTGSSAKRIKIDKCPDGHGGIFKMGDEAVDGSKMGTKLIMFVAIIGLALVAFLVGKALVNTGVDGLETASRNINDSRFSDYNNKVVKGRSVKSALETFANEEVIILVHTLNEGDLALSTGSTSQAENFAREVVKSRLDDDKTNGHIDEDAAKKMTAGDMKSLYAVSVEHGNKKLSLDSNKGIGTAAPLFVNYNALAIDGKVSIDKNGGYIYDADFVTDSNTGSVLYNLQTRYTTKKGSPEYIADGSSFDASLLKNTAGEIVGIVFSQKKVN